MSRFEEIKAKYKKKFEEAMKGVEPISLDTFNDDFAHQISWSPNKKGGYSFKTYKLKDTHSGKLIFEKTNGMKLLPMIGIIPLGFGVFVFSMLNQKEFFQNLEIIIPGIAAFLFLVIYLLLKYNTRKHIFDKTYNYYYRNHFDPGKMGHELSDKVQRFSNIHAIQIISERVKTKNSSFYSYELNLVCKDTSRITIVDHHKHDIIQEHAKRLASFLNVPVWDRGWIKKAPIEILRLKYLKV